ncbi:hypothetical protein VQ056_06835 [Paenibacillus sp. JTLBN-2024]
MVRKTILLVDDDPDIADMLKLFLEKHFDVLEAKDGHEAMELFSRAAVRFGRGRYHDAAP